MPEIIPNLHPIFVHFTVGLLTMSMLFYIGSSFLKNKETQASVRTAGLWMLWSGAVMTLFTVGYGFYAFNTVAHDDPSHLVMKSHRNLALGTASLFILLAGWSFMKIRKKETLPGFFSIGLAIAVILLGVTAWYGGELVYRHGLGVMSLPEAEGEGHSHDGSDEDHDDGDEDHDENAEGEGHSHDGDDDHGASVPVSDQPIETVAYDPASPAGVVNAFHDALKAGDSGTVLAVLSPDVMIYESGYVESSRAEYEGHHMPADMAFTAAMTRTILNQTVSETGNTAMVVTESQTKGTFRDKDYNLLGTETIVLEKADGGWQIIHIHWSSRPSQE